MRRIGVILAVLGLFLTSGMAGAPGASAGNFERCGKVTGQRGSSTVSQKNYNCAGARRVIRVKHSITGDPLGWRCRGTLTVVTCRSGNRVVTGRIV